MRMRARPHLHYAPIPDGVYVGADDAQFALRGSEVLFKVADVCVPMLETGATEDELVAALGSERARPVVAHVVGKLREHGMLLDTERFTVPEPPAAVRERYAESLARLEAVSDDPYAAFAALRAAKVLLTGSPEAVRPAARGLARAGVEQLIEWTDGDGDASYEGVDAVVHCDGDALRRARADGRLPEDVPAVPVLPADRVLVAGPVLRTTADHTAYGDFADRVRAWADGEQAEPAARPVADALTGALAAQLLCDTLAGTAADGEAHVVHGAELVSDRVVVDLSGRPGDAWHTLGDAGAEPMPEPDDALDRAGVVTAPWTGLFSSVMGDDLLQIPVAQRELVPRAGKGGTVVAWAPEQKSATVAAALEALRREFAEGGTGAAGLTEEHWLLDGALRLLTGHARPSATMAEAEAGPETRRFRAALERLGTEPLTLRVLHVPELDWRLGRIEDAGSGEVLARGWAADADSAVCDALGTLLARRQLPATPGRTGAVAPLRTDALLFATTQTLEALRRQVSAWAAAEGVALRGSPRRTDPVLGEIPFWCGPVEARPLTQEAQDEH